MKIKMLLIIVVNVFLSSCVYNDKTTADQYDKMSDNNGAEGSSYYNGTSKAIFYLESTQLIVENDINYFIYPKRNLVQLSYDNYYGRAAIRINNTHIIKLTNILQNYIMKDTINNIKNLGSIEYYLNWSPFNREHIIRKLDTINKMEISVSTNSKYKNYLEIQFVNYTNVNNMNGDSILLQNILLSENRVKELIGIINREYFNKINKEISAQQAGAADK